MRRQKANKSPSFLEQVPMDVALTAQFANLMVIDF
jgi:hypothetical protein